jgi:hypothetical protein
MPFYGDPAYTIPDEAVAVTVDSSSTISSGGSLDWHGRASVIRRPDDTLILGYQRSTRHDFNDGTGIHLRMSDDNGATWSDEDEDTAAAAISGAPLQPADKVSGQDAGEPWFIYAPNGDLLCFTWRVDYNVDNDGTYIFRSTDDGQTWNSGTGPIAWGGLTGDQNLRTFCTDDGFVVGSTIYIIGRVYGNHTYTSGGIVMMTSTDDGVSWTRTTTLISSAGPPTNGAIEAGFERVGPSDFIAMIRDTDHTNSYQKTSTDLGVTWGSTVDVSGTVGIAGRQRVYTRAHLKGEANWWLDPVVLMVGFIQETPGSSQDRRNAVWVSRDHGATWTTPFYIDVEVEDAGYGDIFYDAGNDQYVVINYQGTLTAASIKQYRLTIDGI